MARFLARRGFVSCLRALGELGAGETLSASAANGVTPAHSAAGGGHEECLRALYDMGAGASLSAATNDGATPAHWAAELGHEGCLRTLYQLEAGASLSAATAKGRTPAHCAAEYGHEVRIGAVGLRHSRFVHHSSSIHNSIRVLTLFSLTLPPALRPFTSLLFVAFFFRGACGSFIHGHERASWRPVSMAGHRCIAQLQRGKLAACASCTNLVRVCQRSLSMVTRPAHSTWRQLT